MYAYEVHSSDITACIRGIQLRYYCVHSSDSSVCLDILPKLFVYEAVTSIERAVKEGISGPMIQLTEQISTYVII